MTTAELKTFRSAVTKLARLHAQSQKLAASHVGQNKLWTRRAAERDAQFEVCRKQAVEIFGVPERECVVLNNP